MPIRKSPFETGNYYHIFNRGVDRSSVFRTSRDYEVFLSCLQFYRYKEPSIRFSAFHRLSKAAADNVRSHAEQSGCNVSLLAFALMPNHFHLLVRQDIEGGIHKFLFKALNSFAKNLNTKHKRIGPVFQGNFQAVRIQTDEQLLHVSRYIHLNPVVSGIATMDLLDTYPWTSFPDYVNPNSGWISTAEVLGLIGSFEAYRTFITEQEWYARLLHGMPKLMLDGEDLLTSEVSKQIGTKAETIL